MRKPFWREQRGTWCGWLDNGKLHTLGPDPDGATRKHPPKEIVEGWHLLGKGTPKPKEMTFAQVTEKYLEHLTDPESNKVTSDHLRRFQAHVGRKMKVVDLRVHHVTDYLKTRKWAESTKSTAVCRIVSALNYAVAEGYLDDHPVKFARGRKPAMSRRQTIPGEDQWDALLNATNLRMRTLLAALRESGCRPGELFTATIEHFQRDKGILIVGNKLARQTGEKLRPVFLTDRARDLLSARIGDRAEGHIFLNKRGKPWDRYVAQQYIRRLRDKLGMGKHVSLYSIRHRYCSSAINENDVNVALLALQVGHTDLKRIMKTYLHADTEAMRRAVEKAAKRQDEQ